jgi:hypothetical protein
MLGAEYATPSLPKYGFLEHILTEAERVVNLVDASPISFPPETGFGQSSQQNVGWPKYGQPL